MTEEYVDGDVNVVDDNDDVLDRAVLAPRVLDYIQGTKPDTAILPMIQNASGGQWNGAGLAKMLANLISSIPLGQPKEFELGGTRFRATKVIDPTTGDPKIELKIITD